MSFSDFDKIKEKDTIFLLFGILFLVAPGILEFFVYYRSIFIDVNIVKLLLLAISLVLPASFIYTLVLFEKNKAREENDLFVAFVLSSVCSGLINYCALVIAYFANFSFRQFIEILFAIQIIIFFLLIWIRMDSKKSE